MKSGGETSARSRRGNLPLNQTRRSEWANGSGRRMTESMTLKTAVLAPMPRARVRMATRVKPGDFASMRMANLRSCRIEFIGDLRVEREKLYACYSRRFVGGSYTIRDDVNVAWDKANREPSPAL